MCEKNIGEGVQKGDVVLILEAMKMEILITAPSPGTVVSILCKEGEKVKKGAVLALISRTDLRKHPYRRCEIRTRQLPLTRLKPELSPRGFESCRSGNAKSRRWAEPRLWPRSTSAANLRLGNGLTCSSIRALSAKPTCS